MLEYQLVPNCNHLHTILYYSILVQRSLIGKSASMAWVLCDKLPVKQGIYLLRPCISCHTDLRQHVHSHSISSGGLEPDVDQSACHSRL